MSTITKEQAQKIIEASDEVITALAGTNEDVHPESDSMLRLWDDLNDRYAPPEVVRELARIALASLEADPVYQVLTGDSWVDMSKGAMESQKRVGAIVRTVYTAPPATVSDYPETLPCPVMLEPGLRFGKGVPTRTMLGALQRRAEYCAELNAMTPEQRAEHDAGMKEFAAMLQGAENAGSPTTMKTAPALDYSPKIAESPSGINQGKSEPVTTDYKLPDDFDFDRFNDATWLEAVACYPNMHSLTASTIAMVALELNRKLADGKPELTVWYGSMPESNGKANWTAILHRKGEGRCMDGFTIDRSEYPGRVLYAADRVRYLIGEKSERPSILDYDADAHSGYVKPGNSPVIPEGWQLVPNEPTTKQWAAGMQAFDSGMDKVTRVYKAMIAAAPQQEVK